MGYGCCRIPFAQVVVWLYGLRIITSSGWTVESSIQPGTWNTIMLNIWSLLFFTLILFQDDHLISWYRFLLGSFGPKNCAGFALTRWTWDCDEMTMIKLTMMIRSAMSFTWKILLQMIERMIRNVDSINNNKSNHGKSLLDENDLQIVSN